MKTLKVILKHIVDFFAKPNYKGRRFLEEGAKQ